MCNSNLITKIEIIIIFFLKNPSIIVVPFHKTVITGNADDHLQGIQRFPVQGFGQGHHAGGTVDVQMLTAYRVRYPRPVGIDRGQFVDRFADRSVFGYGKPSHVAPRQELRGAVFRCAFRRSEQGRQDREHDQLPAVHRRHLKSTNAQHL